MFGFIKFFQEYRSYDFRAELSAGHQFDSFIVPNVPFMTAAWELLRTEFFKGLGIKAGLLGTGSKPFVVYNKIDIFN